jgi:hypothetical protein
MDILILFIAVILATLLMPFTNGKFKVDELVKFINDFIFIWVWYLSLLIGGVPWDCRPLLNCITVENLLRGFADSPW